MLRRVVATLAFTFGCACLVLACKGEGAASTGGTEGGAPAKPKKLTCRMEGQCFICPDEAAIKKCIINPVTSGCTKASDGDCN